MSLSNLSYDYGRYFVNSGTSFSPVQIASANAGINLTAANILSKKYISLTATATNPFVVNIPTALAITTYLNPNNPYDGTLLNQVIEFTVWNFSGQIATITPVDVTTALAAGQIAAIAANTGNARVRLLLTTVGNAANPAANPPVAAVSPVFSIYIGG